jgi:hypothetical protein
LRRARRRFALRGWRLGAGRVSGFLVGGFLGETQGALFRHALDDILLGLFLGLQDFLLLLLGRREQFLRPRSR